MFQVWLSRHTIKDIFEVFSLDPSTFIDALSISVHKKFMIFSINHFNIAAQRVKWTEDVYE